eukprot:CAMPEP_0181347252 /NCGR_PEP_ID=MMETSP1101-20121128/33781_1 /TAXON_ID=46948 /ORGANISM="Rhodomonas abbreviata, Strain Caron Lab Isolate" /LENGTH=679 /DNA_ID=CAMNT_0023459457 /DNA_START=152 /DNA_END=2188 /DNA_ORIENTATION=-
MTQPTNQDSGSEHQKDSEESEKLTEKGANSPPADATAEDDAQRQEGQQSQEGPASAELTPLSQDGPASSAELTPPPPLLTRSVLVEMLQQQLKLQEEDNHGETSINETRELLHLIQGESASSRVWPLHDFDQDPEVQDPELQRLLQADVDSLSLQLRCNLATEDRPHLGRIYLNCFVGEDAVSFLETQADLKPLHILGRGSKERSEPGSLASSTQASPAVSPPASPSMGPTDSASSGKAPSSSSRAPSTSSRGEVRKSAGHGHLSRSEAMWVANELLKRGEWQQLTGLDKSQGKSAPFSSPTGKGFVPHPALVQFTLFRMRTAPALNEQYRWSSRTARSPVAVTCHLLHLLASLPFREHHGSSSSSGGGGGGSAHGGGAGHGHGHGHGHHEGFDGMRERRPSNASSVSSIASFDTETDSVLNKMSGGGGKPQGNVFQDIMDSRAFVRFEEASAELQAVDYSALPAKGLLSFLINLHNVMVVHGHCRMGTRDRISDSDRRMFMKAVRYRVGTTHLSLFDVNLILRTRFLSSGRVEPRVHFTLSFGSVSSPSIRCYTPEELQTALEVAAREYCLAVHAVAEERRVLLPIGFKFFASDFAKTRRGLVEYVATYAQQQQQQAIRAILSSEGKTIDIRYIAPNWQLDLFHRLAPVRNPREGKPLDPLLEPFGAQRQQQQQQQQQ